MSRSFTQQGTLPDLERTDILSETGVFVAIPLGQCVVWDAVQTNLPGTSATDDLAVGGTNGIVLTTGDVQGLSVTRYARFQVVLPFEYVAGSALVMRVVGRITDGAAAVASTVDMEVYREDGTGVATSDICSLAAQSMNALSDTTVNFTVSSGTLLPGDVLNCRIAGIVNDTGGVDPCTLRIGRVGPVYTVRG